MGRGFLEERRPERTPPYPKAGRPNPRPSRMVPLVMAGLIVGTLSTPPDAASASRLPADAESERVSILVPSIDPQRGRRLFVTKGCFACHAIQGTGGKSAPPLDANPRDNTIDVLGFVARMLRGAPVMMQLQTLELGYRVELGRQEIADLAGFVGDFRAQQDFSARDIPEMLREWVIDDAFWKVPSIIWSERLPKRFPDLDENDLR